MPSRTSRHSRYDDDPYVVDDPYMKSSPPTNAYEYVGTEDAPSSPRRGPSRSKRDSRGPSPRRGPSRYDESPPRHRHSSSPSRKSHHHRHHGHSRSSPDHERSRGSPDDARGPKSPTSPTSRKQKYQEKYHEFAQRPDVQKAQAAGRKGLNFLGDAAEAYMASQAPHNYERGKAVGDAFPAPRERRYGEGGRDRDRDRDHDRDHERDDRDRRSRGGGRRRNDDYSPSSSPSPSRNRGGRSRDRPSMNGRHKSYSVSPSRGRGSRDSPPSARHRSHGPDYRRDGGGRSRGRDYSTSRSPSPNRPRRKSFLGGSKGGLRASLLETAKGGKGGDAQRWQMAARAALEAGGATALRLRNQPGSWTGDKGAKIATAALGAAALDAFMDKDPRKSGDSGMKGMATNAITGMLATKLMGFKDRKKNKY